MIFGEVMDIRARGIILILLVLVLTFTLQLNASADEENEENDEYDVIIEAEEEIEQELEDIEEGFEFDLEEALELQRDPFDYFGRPEVEDIEEPEDEAAEAEIAEEEPAVTVPEPEFALAGLVRRGGEMVASVKDGSTVELLGLGEEIYGYSFINWENKEAIFEKEGQHFHLSPE